MDLKYVPPTRDPVECSFLRRNFLNCLRDKAARDQVPHMSCNNEHVLFFNLECPEEFQEFQNPQSLRKIFVQQKAIENGPKKPNWVRL